MILHEIHRGAERRAPFLRRARVIATSAVRAPSLDAMRTAPRGRRRNLERAGGRMRRQVIVAVRDDHVVAFFERLQDARQLGSAMFTMMPERLAVGRDHQRRARLQIERGDRNPLRQPRAVGQAVAKRDGVGQLAIESKNRETQIAAAPLERSRTTRLGAGSAKISLVGREDDEPDSRRRDRRERVVIGSAFRQPHPSRLAPEAEDEVVDAPSNLQLAIARRQQRQNRMAVRLRDRVAMPTVARGIQRVATSHRAIGGLAMRLQPSRERRADIETQRLVIIADVNDRPLHRMGMGIGGVAFAEDSLVPVLKRRRAMLRANQTGPRALARGLVKMPVNNDVARFTHYEYVAPPGRAAIARPPVQQSA